MTKGNVLVIGGERGLIEWIRYSFEKEGVKVIGAVDGESGLFLAASEKPFLVIIDFMLPGMLELCRSLRESNQTPRLPVIMLTERASEANWIVALVLSADYITEPVSQQEFGTRVKDLLMRASESWRPPTGITHGNLSINPASHQVCCKDKTIDLTATEYRLLYFLASHPGFVHSRDVLIDEALEKEVTVLKRTIDVHILSLRKKLGKCGEMIETIRGFGYRFRESLPER